MAGTPPRTGAEELRHQAHLLLDLADLYEQPSRSVVRLEMLIGDIERVSADVRAVVRGR